MEQQFELGTNPVPTPPPAAPPAVSRHRRRGCSFWGGQVISVLIILAAIGLRVFYQPVAVHQNSMAPTLVDNDRLLVHLRALRDRLPKRGEIIVFREPESESLVIKRIVALPGETIALVPPGVFINGDRLIEPYAEPLAYRPQRMVVPAGTIIALGDNRPQSRDSRDYGAVPVDRIVGLAVVRFWPWERRARLDHEAPGRTSVHIKSL